MCVHALQRILPPPWIVCAAAGLFVAAGHEGSGLCLGPATAELLGRHVLRHVGANGKSTGPEVGSLDTASFRDLLPDARARAAASSHT